MPRNPFLYRLKRSATRFKRGFIFLEEIQGSRVFKLWEKREKLLEEVEPIRFNCQFNEKGECTRCSPQYGDRTPQCRTCCKTCAESVGYLYFDENNPLLVTKESFEAYKKTFKAKTGFWSTTGCLLPREFRSMICRVYQCKRENVVSEKDAKKLDLIHTKAFDLHSTIRKELCLDTQKGELKPEYQAKCKFALK